MVCLVWVRGLGKLAKFCPELLVSQLHSLRSGCKRLVYLLVFVVDLTQAHVWRIALCRQRRLLLQLRARVAVRVLLPCLQKPPLRKLIQGKPLRAKGDRRKRLNQRMGTSLMMTKKWRNLRLRRSGRSLRNSCAIHKLTFAAQVKTAPKAKAGGAKNEELAGGGLQIGDTIPDTTLKNEKEEDVNVKQLAEDGLVMFVVPKADTRAYSLCPIS